MHSVVTQPKGCSMIGSSIPNGIRPFDTSLERIQLSYKPCNPRAREINKGKYGLKQQAQPLQRGGLQMASTPAKGNQACQGEKKTSSHNLEECNRFLGLHLHFLMGINLLVLTSHIILYQGGHIAGTTKHRYKQVYIKNIRNWIMKIKT